MRLKSYFAPSVQSAISLARRECGDEITLVTSHVASAEARHLGEYEVVFAMDDSAGPETLDPQPAEPQPAAPVFQDLLHQAIAAKPSFHEDLTGKLEQLRASFIEIGIEPQLARALLTLIERSVGYSPGGSAPPAPAEAPVVVCEPAVLVPESIAADLPSVSVGETVTEALDPGLVACFLGVERHKPPSGEAAPKPSRPAASDPVYDEEYGLVGTVPQIERTTAQDTPTHRLPNQTIDASNEIIDASLLAAFSGHAGSPAMLQADPVMPSVPESKLRPASRFKRAIAACGSSKGLLVGIAAAGVCALGQRFRFL